MPVLEVFGHNLRLLCARRRSQASVAADLDIGKVQFQRYLKGQSFPKPNVLKRICDYFDVDARILTERIDPVTGLLERKPLRDSVPDTVTELAKAVEYACPQQEYFPAVSIMADGFYLAHRYSLSRPGMVAAIPLLVKRLDKARVVRGFDLRESVPSNFVPRPPGAMHPREFRGVLLESYNGCSIVFLHAQPVGTVTHMFVSPNVARNDGFFVGFASTGRRETPGLARLVRLVVTPVGARLRDMRRAMRDEVGLHEADRVSPFIRDELDKPLA